jgi:arylsulfatase A-like enzyme
VFYIITLFSAFPTKVNLCDSKIIQEDKKYMNIIYIHTHDSGRYLSPYGHNIPTPNLMEFAKQSTLFRHCYCAAPTCSPSRAALLTGTLPHVNGMLGLAHRGFQMNDYNMHLSSYLKKSGYETVLCGGQHEAPNADMLGYEKIIKVDEPVTSHFERDVLYARKAADYIKEYSEKKNGKNFFLSFGMFCTHREFPQYNEIEKDIKQDYIQPPHVMYDAKTNREDMAGYHALAKTADNCVGIVMDALAGSGIEENTAVIFTTDHGMAFPRMKCNLYDTGIGVAFMIKYPGNPTKGTANDFLISHIDVFPTLCELCGIEIPDWVAGKSFYNILNGGTEEINDEIFAEVTYHAAYEPMRCIRTARYKLIRRYDWHNNYVPSNTDDGNSKRFMMAAGIMSRPIAREMLFDLYLDPLERENVANDSAYRDVYNDLSARLSDCMERTNDPLIHVNHRVPKPDGARANKLTCLQPGEEDLE